MKLQTQRFGELEITDEDVIDFPEGLVGLSRHHRFVLFADPESAELYWLQSVDSPEFAVATVHSSKAGGNYEVELASQDLDALQTKDAKNLEAFLILNRVDKQFSVNLRGPIIINAERMVGKQVVLKNPAYGVRHHLQSAEPEMSTAVQGDLETG